MGPVKGTDQLIPTRKNVAEVKFKYSPQKRSTNKNNQVFVKEFKFGLLSLQLKKGTNLSDDAYFKDFIDAIDNDSDIAEKLGIIKVSFVRDSSKCNLPKLQTSSYKCRQILGIAPQDKENNPEFRKLWAEKIIEYLNSEINWKYENVFKFKADITRTNDNKICSSLDECLLDEDIGGFVGTYLFDDVATVKNNLEIMKNIFGNEENLEIGENVLLANWQNWNNDE